MKRSKRRTATGILSPGVICHGRRDTLPLGVGAAGSGLHSTGCRSSDGGEVHSLEENYITS